MRRLLWLVLALAPGVALPHSGDDPLAQWYNGLERHSGMTTYRCCSIADCKPVNYRIKPAGFEVFVSKATFGDSAPDAWIAVPPENVLHQHDNPTGEGIACWYMNEIRCFVEASGT